ncbi:MAG: hypothetical protein KatS3mg068_0298 [Candidatus Sericytochromatia bacterium]|nr:MAG: hypothetical protein KatS3mg068_0298 [Candidatus Sericytochromatia bacterium]
MKSYSSFLISLLVASNLFACSVQSDFNLQPVSNIGNSQNQISTMSAKGLDDYMNFQVKFVFDKMDKNKNKYISKTEYVEYFKATLPPSFVQDLQLEEPKIENNNTLTFSKDKIISSDPEKRFSSVDKNKDSRITLKEAKDSISNFLGTTKADIRKSVSLMFAYMDKNQNKNLSKQEFMATFEGASYELKTSMLAQFNLADKNKNNSLTFSEFEDMYYAISKAYLELPLQQPSPSPTPAPVEPPSSSEPPSDVPPPSEPTNPSEPPRSEQPSNN